MTEETPHDPHDRTILQMTPDNLTGLCPARCCHVCDAHAVCTCSAACMKHMQYLGAVRQSRNEYAAKSLLQLTAHAFDKLVVGPIKAGMTLLPRKRSYTAISFLISSQPGSWASSSQASATSHTLYTAGVKSTLPLRTCEYHVMNCLAQTTATANWPTQKRGGYKCLQHNADNTIVRHKTY